MCHGSLILGRAPEVADKDLPKPDAILHDDGFVQVVLFTQEVELYFVEGLAGADEGSDGVAGDGEHERVDHEGDDEEHGHDLQ